MDDSFLVLEHLLKFGDGRQTLRFSLHILSLIFIVKGLGTESQLLHEGLLGVFGLSSHWITTAVLRTGRSGSSLLCNRL